MDAPVDTSWFDERLTGAQAARMVGVSRQLVRRWTQLGHLVKVDGKYRALDVLEAEARTRQRSGRKLPSMTDLYAELAHG